MKQNELLINSWLLLYNCLSLYYADVFYWQMVFRGQSDVETLVSHRQDVGLPLNWYRSDLLPTKCLYGLPTSARHLSHEHPMIGSAAARCSYRSSALHRQDVVPPWNRSKNSNRADVLPTKCRCGLPMSARHLLHEHPMIGPAAARSHFTTKTWSAADIGPLSLWSVTPAG